MAAYTAQAWESFGVANTGAAAALAGLVFVGVSINLSTIAASGRLSRRALETVLLLATTLVASVLLLVPEISSTALGVCLLVLGLVAWSAIATLEQRTVAESRHVEVPGPRHSVLAQVLLGQAAVAPFGVAGATLLAETGGGLYWLVPAVVFGYLAALSNAWVLLVEVTR